MPEKRIYILTGPVQTGKTTSLVNWSAKRDDVFGILTPVAEDKRVFMNAHSREQFPMEATRGETETVTIGRFVFSETSFNKAIQVIRDAIHKEGWLVIDEIGPLELSGEGFAVVINEVSAVRNDRILVVVREGLVEKVKEVFQVINATIIHHISELDK